MGKGGRINTCTQCNTHVHVYTCTFANSMHMYMNHLKVHVQFVTCSAGYSFVCCIVHTHVGVVTI